MTHEELPSQLANIFKKSCPCVSTDLHTGEQTCQNDWSECADEECNPIACESFQEILNYLKQIL